MRVLVTTGLARTALQVPPMTPHPTVPLRWSGGVPETAAVYRHETGFPTWNMIVSDPIIPALTGSVLVLSPPDVQTPT